MKSKKLLWLIPAAILLVIAIVLSVLLTAKPAEAVDALLALNTKGGADRLRDMAPNSYWIYLEVTSGISTDSILEEFNDEWEEYLSFLEDQYGTDIRSSYVVTDERSCTRTYVHAIADALSNQYAIDPQTISDAKSLQVDVTITGSLGSETTTEAYTVVKISGNWYIIYISEGETGKSIYFHTFG